MVKKEKDDISELPYLKVGKSLHSMICIDCKQNYYYDNANFKQWQLGSEDTRICTSCGGKVIEFSGKASQYDI
jgi:hypothetical protein